MQTSIFIAKLIGPAMGILGIALLANRENFVQAAREAIDSRAYLMMAGLMALALGLVLVNTHNVWSVGWPLIITVLGWASLAAGIMRLVFPAQVRKMGETMISDGAFLGIAGAAYIVLGGVLSYYGYFV